MEHAQELLNLAIPVIGFLIVYVLNGIKSEIKDVKDTVRSLETDLRGGITGLDRRQSVLEQRLAKIEARCDAHYG